MKKLFNFLINKPIISLFIIIVIFFIPSAIVARPQSFSKLIVRTIGIDKIGDEYEVSVVAYIPRPTQTFSENFQVISAKGNSVYDSFTNISKLTGKTVALAESNLILVNDGVCEDGLLKTLDYFVREYSLENNTLLLNIQGSTSKEVLEITKKIAKDVSIFLQDIAEYNKNYILSSYIWIEELYAESLSPNGDIILSVIKLKENDGLGLESEQSQGSSSADSLESQSGGGTNSSSSNGKNKKLVNEGDAIVLKKGKKVMELSYNEIFSLFWGKDRMDFGVIELDNYNDKICSNAKVGLSIFDNKVKFKTKFEGEKPICEILIKPRLILSEISQDIITKDFLNETYHIDDEMLRKALDKKIGFDFSSILRKTIENDVDVLDVYEIFYTNNTKNFYKLLNNLENPDKYISEIEFRIKVETSIFD